MARTYWAAIQLAREKNIYLMGSHVKASRLLLRKSILFMGGCVMRDESNCKECKKNTKSHPCPFAQEINNDDTECNCCEDCTDECSMDI